MKTKLKTRIVYLIFIVGVFSGFMGFFADSFWKGWEISAMLVTIVYTLVLYIFGFIQEEFEGMRMKDFALVALAFFGLIVVTFISTQDYIKTNNIEFTFTRLHNLIGLTITSALFWFMDNAIHRKCTKTEIRTTFKLSKIYSDKPITIIFGIMTAYYIYLHNFCPEFTNYSELEPFFSGAIAFQMMISNLIWTINDDTIIEEKKLETCKEE